MPAALRETPPALRVVTDRAQGTPPAKIQPETYLGEFRSIPHCGSIMRITHFCTPNGHPGAERCRTCFQHVAFLAKLLGLSVPASGLPPRMAVGAPPPCGPRFDGASGLRS